MEFDGNLGLFLVSVVAISLSGVMMPGPVTAVTVVKGHKQRNAGALIAVGHGIIEYPLIGLIYLGFARFLASDGVKLIIGLLGGLVLVYMGLQMFRIARKNDIASKDVPYGSLVAGIAATAANPYFFLWWATVGAALVARSNWGLWGLGLLALTHWLCDFLWYSFVSATVFKSRRLWTPQVHSAVFTLCALTLLGFGSWFIISAL